MKGFLIHVTSIIAKDPEIWSLFADFVRLAEYDQLKENAEEAEKRVKGSEIVELEMKCVTSLMVPGWEK